VICLNVLITARGGEEHRIAELFAKLQAASRQEPGCLMYVVHQHVSDPRKFLVYEQYEDEAALELHRNSAHFQEIAANTIYKLIDAREAELYRPL
jgi:(4S)-4-hydroxy-5-phosphonooxypentane-2,3-dione isomerase